jgi:RNA polymerase subunit RPABC4/transcription elongation factor Spt4
MRAAFCQDCGTYVPKDTRNCPKCHALHISKDAAKRYDFNHPINSAVWFSGKKSKRSTTTLRDGHTYHLKPKTLPDHCPWCGAQLRWGEDKARPGTWIGLDAQKAHYGPSGHSIYSRAPSGWSFNLVVNRHQITSGGAYQEHECSHKFDKSGNPDMGKATIYVEALAE